MSLRFRIYRFFRRSKGSLLRLVLADLLVLVGFGLLVALINLRLGSIELRWGLVVWYGFLNGFTGLVLLNAIIELCGTGYPSRQPGSQEQRSR